jgi:hypothetical protein
MALCCVVCSFPSMDRLESHESKVIDFYERASINARFVLKASEESI